MNKTFSGEKPIALITGATSGIGEAYARHLAAGGWDLALVDQSRSHMEGVAREFRQNYGTSCKILDVDVADPTVLLSLEKDIQGIPRIDMLINDSGYWTPGSYEETDPFTIEDMIRVHNIVPARLIRSVLPFMKKQNRGTIINVSSLAAVMNIPHNENYSATKAYLVSLTESLKTTLYQTGIQLQVLLPGLPFGAHGMMMPGKMVEYSLKMLKKDRVVCIPDWRSRFYIWKLKILPKKLYYRKMYNLGEALRREWGL